MILYPVIAAVVIGLDQITKYLVRSSMQPGESIPVIGSWLRILYVRNTGTAFSMFAGNKWITVVFTTVLIIACIIYVIHEARSGSRTVSILLTFVIAGGVSNMIDRLTLGYVTDMISCGNFAVFNVADIAVTCGCALTILYLLMDMRKEGKSDHTEG
jgi:signal peptidase II